MTTDSKRSKALFLIARGITDSKLRIEYLDRECGEDTELRQRVEVLLSAPDETTGYNLQQHVSRGVEHEVCPAIPERGALLGGRYRLQEPLGEGGMGSVWLAEQTEPVKRTVAAKLIKPGMDSQQVLARFDAERQALAMMDHPNIAKVFDGGMTAEGRPFFVMEYVKGVPLIEYCDGIQLSLSNRLRLFIQICHAIQHAHQKGIIHRDLKPSNILVYEYDGTPVPKVIDFGLAKAMHQSLTEQSLYTAQGMMIGTPLYMSPEQVDRNHLDIDTRSDIYALGVVLYELLTGSTPLERKQMERATYSEILRLIKEVEPPRPSARISRSDGLPRIASQRRLEPSQLTKTLTGDLDWIVMKALDKDRDRRYETANALSRDVERFLNDEPVAAYPPSVSYRFKKMIRKYKRHVLAVSMVVVAMVGGVLAVVVMQAQKNHELRTLNIQLDEANTELKSTNIRLDKQREVAEEREQQAINAVKKFGDTIAETPELKNNPSLDSLRKTLLKEPITFLQSLRDQLEQVESPSKKSLAQLAFANLELAKLTDEIGNKQDALNVIQVSIEIWNRLLQANPEVVAYRHSLAVSYVTSGSLLEDVGRMSEVMPQYQRAAQLLQELNLEQPEDFGFGKNLIDVVTLMGNVELGAGQLDNALEYYDTALGISTRFVPDATETSSYQHSLGNLYHNVGYVHAQRGQSDLSLEMYKKAVEVQEKLTIQEPANTKFKSALAHTYTNIGQLMVKGGQNSSALELLEKSEVLYGQLVESHPSKTQFLNDLAQAKYNIGFTLGRSGRIHDALAKYMQSLEIQTKLLESNPFVFEFQKNLLVSCNNVVFLYLRYDDLPTIRNVWIKVRPAIERLSQEHDIERLSALASLCNAFGALMYNEERNTEAMELLLIAQRLFERSIKEGHASSDITNELGGVLSNLGEVHLSEKRFEEARTLFQRAIELQRSALSEKPDSPSYRDFLLSHLKGQISACRQLRDETGAKDGILQFREFQESNPNWRLVESRLHALGNGPDTTNNQERLELAQLAYEVGRYLSAARLYEEAIQVDPKLVDDREIRYNAACSASMAANGADRLESASLDDGQKARLREQVLSWLALELEQWSERLRNAPESVQASAARTLLQWQRDFDLEQFRDSSVLERLPESERHAWMIFWHRVEEVRRSAAAKSLDK